MAGNEKQRTAMIAFSAFMVGIGLRFLFHHTNIKKIRRNNHVAHANIFSGVFVFDKKTSTFASQFLRKYYL